MLGRFRRASIYQSPLSPIQLLIQPPYARRAMSILQAIIRSKT
jgi:coniferyl-aldehyde dehydrogenase